MTPATRDEAFALLERIGAPQRLLRHGELVCEAADLLIEGLVELRVPIHADFIRVGAVLHDAGKAIRPEELERPGNAHEPAGEQLLLQYGATTEIARVCRSHAQWRELETTLDELLVALSDKLWKGVRAEELEKLVIERIAALLKQQHWEAFAALDALFERVAVDSDSRLERSVTCR